MSWLDSYRFKTHTRPLNSIKPPLTPPAGRPPTDVEWRVPWPGKVIDVGDTERLNGHRADSEQQLSRRHEWPQSLGIDQLSAFVPTTSDLTGVDLRAADVLAAWGRQRHRQ